MTKVVIGTAFATLLMGAQIGVGEAAWGDGPGCGLGEMVFKSQPKSILLQNFGSTLNVPTQPFAITSGTSGCTNNGMIVKHEAVKVFVTQNVGHVSQDMARGQGEHLTSLATLMGIPPDRQAEFFALAQELFWETMQRQGTSDEAIEEDAPRAVLIALQERMRIQSIPSKTPSNY
jgi:hypothetical protein